MQLFLDKPSLESSLESSLEPLVTMVTMITMMAMSISVESLVASVEALPLVTYVESLISLVESAPMVEPTSLVESLLTISHDLEVPNLTSSVRVVPPDQLAVLNHEIVFGDVLDSDASVASVLDVELLPLLVVGNQNWGGRVVDLPSEIVARGRLLQAETPFVSRNNNESLPVLGLVSELKPGVQICNSSNKSATLTEGNGVSRVRQPTT